MIVYFVLFFKILLKIEKIKEFLRINFGFKVIKFYNLL